MAALLRKFSIKRCLTALLVTIGLFAGTSVAIFGATAVPASAAVHVSVGQDGNNIVCGGVPTLARAIFYAKGGINKCANGKVHTDVGADWAARGITLQVVEKMVSGTVCGSQGLWSTGRQKSPDPSNNIATLVDHHIVYVRPLSDWGSGVCYSAWVGYTEDGQRVAILKGCGNAESTEKLPPVIAQLPPTVKTVACTLGTTPEYSVPAGYTVQNGDCVSSAQFCATDEGGTWSGVTGICTVTVSNCSNVNNVTGSTGSGITNVYITETGNCNVTPTQTVVVTPPPTVVVVNTPPPPPVVPQPQVSCSLSWNITNGNTVSVTVFATPINGTVTAATIAFASGVSTSESVYGTSASGTYTYPAPGTYIVTASVQVTGSTGTKVTSPVCSTSVTIPTPPVVVVPPQPPTVYGLVVPENTPGSSDPGPISIGETGSACADVNAPVGDSLTVTFASTSIGDFQTPTQTVTSVGTTYVCATYSAPTNAADTGSDTYTVSVYDSTTKLFAALETSSSFTIVPAAVRPS